MSKQYYSDIITIMTKNLIQILSQSSQINILSQSSQYFFIQIIAQSCQQSLYSDIITIIWTNCSFRYYNNHLKQCFVQILAKYSQKNIQIISQSCRKQFRYYHNHLKNIFRYYHNHHKKIFRYYHNHLKTCLFRNYTNHANKNLFRY